MSQKLDKLKRDFESEFDKFYDSKLKGAILDILIFTRERETLIQIYDEMSYKFKINNYFEFNNDQTL